MEELSMVTIVMIGGPGSGKSTYSKYISGHFDIPHIYTGDMMRDLQKKDKEVAKIMDRGDLVPIEKVMKALKDRLGKDTNYFLNSDKLKNQLNWKPLIDLNKGIEKCIIWVSNNLEVLKKEPQIYKHKI